MKAVILAAGKGKRMGELTRSLPKPMVEVHGKPLLEHVIEGLRDHAGIRSVFLVTGHCAEVIENHFSDGHNWGMEIAYGRQEIPDGTGKAPEIAAAWLDGSPFLLSYGDILVQPSAYARIVDAFDADGVLTVRRGENLAQGGAVVLDEQGFVSDLIEKAAPGSVNTPWYNAGIYAFRSNLFDYTARLTLSARGEYELTDAIRSMAADGLHIRGVEISGQWADVRDPDVLQRLNEPSSS